MAFILTLCSILNGLVWACWRRIYGEGTVSGLAGNRTVQSLTAVQLLLPLFVFNASAALSWLFAAAVSCWLVFQFWSRPVAEILDCGQNQSQTKDNYSRWFRIPLDFVYERLGKTRYQGSYDWWYCTLRYSLCMLPLSCISLWFIVPGLTAAPIYWGCSLLYKRQPQLIASAGVWLDSPKNLAELLHGFVYGFSIFWAVL